MMPVTRIQTGEEFRALVHAKAERIQSIPMDEKTLEFIQNAFQAIAAGRGTISVGEHVFDVKDLNDKELRALCLLSKKFFNANKDIHLNGEFLANIQTVRNRPHSHRTAKLLDPLRLQIYRNETVDPSLGGVREKLQTELLTEIKTKGIELEETKKKSIIKKIAAWVGPNVVLGTIFATGLGLAFSSAALTAGIGLLVFGVLATAFVILGSIYATSGQSGEIRKLEREQKDRLWAFELLQNKEKFDAFCAEKGIEDSENVTFVQLLKARYKPS